MVTYLPGLTLTIPCDSAAKYRLCRCRYKINDLMREVLATPFSFCFKALIRSRLRPPLPQNCWLRRVLLRLRNCIRCCGAISSSNISHRPNWAAALAYTIAFSLVFFNRYCTSIFKWKANVLTNSPISPAQQLIPLLQRDPTAHSYRSAGWYHSPGKPDRERYI